MEIKITIPRAQLGDLIPSSQTVAEAAGRAVFNLIKGHLAERNNKTSRRAGFPKSNYWGEAAQSVEEPVITESSASISITKEGVALHYYGGTVRPNKAKALAKLGADKNLAPFVGRVQGKPLTVNQTWRDAKRPNGTTHLAHFYDNPDYPDDLPLHIDDVELLPTLWRNPDRVRKIQRDVFEAQLDTFDGSIIVAQFKVKDGKPPQLWTFYKKKSSMESPSASLPE